MIDQTKLPNELVYVEFTDFKDVAMPTFSVLKPSHPSTRGVVLPVIDVMKLLISLK